ncbi:hypothetical protein SAMN06265220_103690 [Flavobacterium nitrogenifigens]|uniref:Uncharacterized protein n=1 Tax=Flavobacterium nitrogenifigens TaxID=1617283 RepID=A0A521E039_9FLAO|nr:hypothetical protein SAMN06265220_103690 [Flavobacterium nitrogenifigens]
MLCDSATLRAIFNTKEKNVTAEQLSLYKILEKY